jgi:exodeoxyribonuclease-3
VRIISFNANGLRAATAKGFFNWFRRQKADVLCVQELKAQPEQLAPRQFHARGYHRFLRCAERPGYSGVAIYSRDEPVRVQEGFGNSEFDAEGRYIEVEFAELTVASVYFPSGSSSEARQEAKFRFLPSFEAFLIGKLKAGKPFVFCGDINIAHREIDLKNWRSNRKNSGFLPEERAWMDELFGVAGFVDAFRVVNQDSHQYTWWSNRGQAWAKNVGWRVDYQVVTPAIAASVRAARIYKQRRFSDHAPLIMDYDDQLIM